MRRKIFGISALVLGLGLCAFSVWRSPVYQSCRAEKAQHAADKKQDERNSAFMVNIDCLGPFTHENHGPITAVFTILLGFGTFLVWWATRDLVEGAEKTARKQLRAYVFVAQAQIIDPDGPDPRGEITIKNFGQTPAYDVVLSAIFKGFNPTDPRIFYPAVIDEKSSRFVLAPTQGGSKSMPLDTLLNTGTMAGLRAKGQHILYAWGLIDYRDAFGKHQTVEFRVSIGGPGGWPKSNLMVIDPQGNKER